MSTSPVGWPVRVAVIGGLVVILASALYEAAVALRMVDLGRLPGADAPHRGALLWLAMTVLLLGGIALTVAGIAAIGRDAYGRPATFGSGLLAMPALRLVPISAAAFFLAHHLSYDAYYAPQLRRYSVNIPTGFVILILCWGVVAAAGLRLRWTSAASAIAAGGLLFTIPLAVVLGGGH